MRTHISLNSSEMNITDIGEINAVDTSEIDAHDTGKMNILSLRWVLSLNSYTSNLILVLK